MRVTYRLDPSARVRIMIDTGRDPRIMQHLFIDPIMLTPEDQATLDAALHSEDGEHAMLVMPDRKYKDERDLMTLEKVVRIEAALEAYRTILEKQSPKPQ